MVLEQEQGLGRARDLSLLAIFLECFRLRLPLSVPQEASDPIQLWIEAQDTSCGIKRFLDIGPHCAPY